MSDDVKREENEAFLKYYDAFKDEMGNFEQRLTDMQVSFDDAQRAHAAGVQNVYNEFKVITDGSLLISTKFKLDEMKEELIDFKREIREDIKFVKKCYRIMPSISRIKELDDESYEKLVKILELVKG